VQNALKNRWVKIGAQAAVLTALILGLVMFVGGSKTLAVAVDGQSQSITTRAATVAEVLEDSSITLDELDEITPALDAPVADGAVIDIKRHKEVNVSIDGVDRVVHTTGLTVADVVDQLNVSEKAQIEQGRALSLASLVTPIDISTPKDVSIKADGKTKKLNTTAETVGAALKEAKITLGKDDELNAKVADAVSADMELKIVRVKTKTVTETEVIDHGTDTVKDSDALVGTKKTLEEGKDGERTLTYTVTLRDGKESKRELASDKVTTKAVDAEVSVGTKPKPKPKAPTTSGSVSSTWAALAKCESGGNPRAVNPAGYYGLYQFSLSTWRSVGGSGNPVDAGADEQTARAQTLYNKAGAAQWGCGRHLFD